METRIETVMTNLRHNKMQPYYVENVNDVVPLVESLLSEGDVIGVGGSETLKQTGVLPLVRSEKYRLIDRYDPTLTPEERRNRQRDAIYADVFLTSSNAITEDGELYNVDGIGNRVAAIAFGPKSVIVVAGVNKIVKDINEAIRRVKTIAAPLNAKRLNCDTYCQRIGYCKGLDGGMTDGCGSPSRICCQYLISGMQREPNRIKVILVGEECGF